MLQFRYVNRHLQYIILSFIIVEIKLFISDDLTCPTLLHCIALLSKRSKLHTGVTLQKDVIILFVLLKSLKDWEIGLKLKNTYVYNPAEAV